jgi:hypothetical protein
MKFRLSYKNICPNNILIINSLGKFSKTLFKAYSNQVCFENNSYLNIESQKLENDSNDYYEYENTYNISHKKSPIIRKSRNQEIFNEYLKTYYENVISDQQFPKFLKDFSITLENLKFHNIGKFSNKEKDIIQAIIDRFYKKVTIIETKEEFLSYSHFLHSIDQKYLDTTPISIKLDIKNNMMRYITENINNFSLKEILSYISVSMYYEKFDFEKIFSERAEELLTIGFMELRTILQRLINPRGSKTFYLSKEKLIEYIVPIYFRISIPIDFANKITSLADFIELSDNCIFLNVDKEINTLLEDIMLEFDEFLLGKRNYMKDIFEKSIWFRILLKSFKNYNGKLPQNFLKNVYRYKLTNIEIKETEDVNNFLLAFNNLAQLPNEYFFDEFYFPEVLNFFKKYFKTKVSKSSKEDMSVFVFLEKYSPNDVESLTLFTNYLKLDLQYLKNFEFNLSFKRLLDTQPNLLAEVSELLTSNIVEQMEKNKNIQIWIDNIINLSIFCKYSNSKVQLICKNFIVFLEKEEKKNFSYLIDFFYLYTKHKYQKYIFLEHKENIINLIYEKFDKKNLDTVSSSHVLIKIFTGLSLTLIPDYKFEKLKTNLNKIYSNLFEIRRMRNDTLPFLLILREYVFGKNLINDSIIISYLLYLKTVYNSEPIILIQKKIPNEMIFFAYAVLSSKGECLKINKNVLQYFLQKADEIYDNMQSDNKISFIKFDLNQILSIHLTFSKNKLKCKIVEEKIKYELSTFNNCESNEKISNEYLKNIFHYYEDKKLIENKIQEFNKTFN